MGETIPDDILSAAVAVVDRGYDTGLIDAVAAALMAERERCAKIAEQRDPEKPDNYLHKRERIAAAIRTPPTGEEQ